MRHHLRAVAHALGAHYLCAWGHSWTPHSRAALRCALTTAPALRCVMQEEDLKDAILLVFANKQDMRGALNAAQISEAMGLAGACAVAALVVRFRPIAAIASLLFSSFLTILAPSLLWLRLGVLPACHAIDWRARHSTFRLQASRVGSGASKRRAQLKGKACLRASTG